MTAKIILSYYYLCKKPNGNILNFCSTNNLDLADLYDIIFKFKLPFYKEALIKGSLRTRLFSNLTTKTDIALSDQITLLTLRNKKILAWVCFDHLMKKKLKDSDFIRIRRLK